MLTFPLYQTKHLLSMTTTLAKSPLGIIHVVVWSGNMAETSKASMELNDNNPSDSSSYGSEDSESERSCPATSIPERL